MSKQDWEKKADEAADEAPDCNCDLRNFLYDGPCWHHMPPEEVFIYAYLAGAREMNDAAAAETQDFPAHGYKLAIKIRSMMSDEENVSKRGDKP